MLFEELVKQHRVQRVVAHRVDLAVIAAHYQVWVYFGYFLGDHTKLRCAPIVALVVKCHRLEREDGFAGFGRRFNLFFETAQ